MKRDNQTGWQVGVLFKPRHGRNSDRRPPESVSRLIAILCSALALTAPTQSYGSSLLQEARVLGAGVYGDGSVWVTLDRPHDQAGCPGPYLEFPPGGATKSVLATAQLAIATGSTVFVQVNGCLSLAGTFTGVRNGSAFGINAK